MNFEQSAEFKKDVKRLSKKWRSLPNDVLVAEKYILPLYQQLADDIDIDEYRKAFFSSKKATIIHASEGIEVVKMRLDCESLGNNSKTRIVFVMVKTQTKVVFLELYSKSDKDREDRRRIVKYLKTLE